MNTQTELSVADFYSRLNLSLSEYHARMVLKTVLSSAGITVVNEADKLSAESAKSICLELIKKGGPAFQVGKTLYSQIQ